MRRPLSPARPRRQPSAPSSPGARRLRLGTSELPLFVTEWCDLLGAPKPDPARYDTRGAYGSTRAQFANVLGHLLSSPQITVEDRAGVEAALFGHQSGLDFADALHQASCRNCDSMASFDDRKFARRANKPGLAPKVNTPR